MRKKHYLPEGYKPTKEEANKYIARPYGSIDVIGNKHEETLEKLFQKLIPENKNIHDILIKCSTLNGLANTVIYEVQYVAEWILKLKIDDRLKRGDLSLVDQIAYNVKDANSQISRSYYSFASKYCSYHQPDKYSIYDRYVDIVLWELQKKYHYSDFKHDDLKKYKGYMKALDDFRNYYGFPEEEFSKKDLDKFLWLLGKEWVRKFDEKK